MTERRGLGFFIFGVLLVLGFVFVTWIICTGRSIPTMMKTRKIGEANEENAQINRKAQTL